MCNRVAMRMACAECGYPLSEAAEDTSFSIEHMPWAPTAECRGEKYCTIWCEKICQVKNERDEVD